MRSEREQKLIDAVNLIANVTQDELPDGFELTLTFNRYEASIDLSCPEGNNIELVLDGDNSSVTDAIEHAKDWAKTHDEFL